MGEAVLLHSWSGTPVEFDDNGTTRKMLEDTVGNLDLKPTITWKGSGIADNFTSDKYYDTNFDIPRDISFTLKFNQYTRNSNYFGKLTYFNSGPIAGINISSYDKYVSGRFAIRIATTSNLTYGPGTLEFGYMDGVGNTLIYLDKNTSVKFNQNETHDITLTFNADTKEAKLYQDTTLVLSHTFDFNLYFSGFNMDAFQESSIGQIELYQGIVEPS